MYRTIDTATWTDPKVRSLPPDGKLLFVYLFTNSHTHVSGIYYLPRILMSHETGIKEQRLDTLLDTLSDADLVKWDRVSEVVWVKKMFDRQGPGAKHVASAARHLATLHNSWLIKEFLDFYSHRQIPYQYPIDTSSLARAQEQEQEQEKDINLLPPEGGCAEPENGSEQSAPIMVFPVVGKGPKWWGLTQAKLDEYRETYPGLDVEALCRKALQWCRDNPTKRKTARGMPAFLNSWLSWEQNRPSRGGSADRRGGGPKPDPLEGIEL